MTRLPSTQPIVDEDAPMEANLDIGEIYRRHGHVVFRRAQTLLGDEHEAREVLQEIFLSLVSDPGLFEGRSAITTWLYRVTTNTCLNRMRNQRNRTRLLEENVMPLACELRQESAAVWAEARRYIARMPEELAKVTIFYSIDGMTHDEIASVMGCSRRHVGNLLNRAQMWAQAQEASK